MKKLFLFWSLALFGGIHNRSCSQNLVPNSGFEQNSGIPTNIGEWILATGWSNLSGGLGWPYATPDYLHTSGTGWVNLPNSVFGTVSPYNGNAIMGLCIYSPSTADFREYISIQLSSPMITGAQYSVSFYISNGIQSSTTAGGIATDKLQVHFSTAPLSQIAHEPIIVTPHFTLGAITYTTNWQLVSATITAQGPWQYITIGNFYDDANTTTQNIMITQYPSAYYFIDEVSVEPIFSIIGPDSVCAGASVTLSSPGGVVCQWAEAPAPASIISTSSSITVSPSATTTYLLYGSNDTASMTLEVVPYPTVSLPPDTILCEDYSMELEPSASDSSAFLWSTGSTAPAITATAGAIYWVNLTVNGCTASDTIVIAEMYCATDLQIPNIFSPNGDGINDFFSPLSEAGIKTFSFSIYDRWGIKMFSTENSNFKWDGKTTGGNPAPDGTYYYVARYTDTPGNEKEAKGFLLLTR